jgi:hypothetical protein
MKKLKIEITKACLTGFDVKFDEHGTPDVGVNIALLTDQDKEITTLRISTSSWRDEDKFELPIGMITPIKQIAAALEEVIVAHVREGQAKLGSGE